MSSKASAQEQVAAAPSQDVSAESIVLQPIRETGVDALVVFAPGVTAPKEYLPLATEFQSASELKLWVVILNPPNVISTEITEGSFDGVLEKVKSLGFKPGQLAMDNVFLAGHSWGAWTARTVALRRAQGFIQMGSCFDKNADNLSQYPKPVLTLNGELDGQLTLAATAKHAGEIFSVEPEMGSFNTYCVKPVILIPGMNHNQFSHGIPNKERGDLDAGIPLEDARRAAAELVAAFLAVNVGSSSSSTTALTKLEEAVKQTQEMCKPFWEAISMQGKQQISKKYQLDLAGLPSEVINETGVTVVEHDYEDNFIYSKPWIDTKQPKVFVQTYLNPYGKYGIVKSLWIKMKSQEAMVSSFSSQIESSSSSSGSKTDSRLAAEFNDRIFAEALQVVPPKARNRYLERGKQVKFVDDLVVTDSSIKWIKSDVSIRVGDEHIEVQSPVLISPVEGIAPRFAGMHYMKLLTMAGAMQVILEDCLRK